LKIYQYLAKINSFLLKQKTMKTKIILLLIFGFVGFKTVVAQDFSAFYKVYDGTAKDKYNSETGYELTSAEDLVFRPLTESTLDIRFEMMVLKADADETSVFIRIGNEQQVEFEVGFNNGLTTRANGEMVEHYGYVMNQVEEENSKTIELHFVLRIGKDMVRPFSYGEMGNNNITDQYETDDSDIHIRTVSKGETAIKLAIETEFTPQLSSFAKSGLKLRKTADLNGETLGSISYGTSIYILDSLDSVLPIYDFSMVNTKGDLKTNDLSSRMVKVLYDNKIGYVYGGYLLPFRQLKPTDAKTQGDFNNWTNYYWGILAEAVFHQKKLNLKKGIINFGDYPYESMDVSQWKYLLTEFFPNALTIEKLNTLLKENKIHTFEIKSGDYEEAFEITVVDNQLQTVIYTKTINGLLDKLVTNKNGYVVADNLNMRQSADAASNVITKIPFGELVTIVDNSTSFSIIGDVRGKMVKIKYNGKEGYVFDAYLSPTKPLELKKGKTAIVSFDEIMKTKIDTEWKYNGFGWIDDEWLIIPSRDKFQALKTLRKLCPELNDLSLKWNESKNDYDVETTSKRISVYEYEGQWTISINDEKDEVTIIVIETITNNIQKVVVFREEIGC
jgi:uncharacterized protein YgiM (DUF1202 family)